MDEKPRRRASFTLQALFVLVTVAAVYAAAWRAWSSIRSPSPENWRMVQVGMTISQVHDLLGRPKGGGFSIGHICIPYIDSVYEDLESFYLDDGQKVTIYYQDGVVTRVSSY